MNDADVARIADWLQQSVTVEGRAFAGSSNITWLVRLDGRDAVLRHPPRDADRLPTAHDVLREARVLQAIANSPGASVRVPTVLATCNDDSILGVPFVITARCPGVCLLSTALPHLEPTALAFDAIDSLAGIHLIDVRQTGLETPAGSYLSRQIDRWYRQLDRTPTASRLGDLAPIVSWLHEHRPSHEAQALVHGDYGFHNLLVSETQVEAVLDWELATIGDPIADLYSLLKSWGATATTPNPANDAVARRPGAPTSDELLTRYEDRTGHDARAHRRFYEAFGVWRSIGIFEGIHARSGGTRFIDDTPRLVAGITAMMSASPGAR